MANLGVVALIVLNSFFSVEDLCLSGTLQETLLSKSDPIHYPIRHDCHPLSHDMQRVAYSGGDAVCSQ
jgi:hypothetical protein